MRQILLKSARNAEKELGLDKWKKIQNNRRLIGCEEMENLYNNLRNWHQIWKETKSVEARDNWKRCKKDLRRKQREEIDLIKRRHCGRICNLYHNDRFEFWRHVAKLRKSRDTSVDLNKINFVDYYKKLYSNSDSKSDRNENHQMIENVVRAKAEELRKLSFPSMISFVDMKQAIGNLSIGKSSGFDDLCAEMFKYGEKGPLVVILTWLFGEMFKLGYVPMDFNISLITPIPKKREISDNPADFRPISVSTTFALIFEDLI